MAMPYWSINPFLCITTPAPSHHTATLFPLDAPEGVEALCQVVGPSLPPPPNTSMTNLFSPPPRPLLHHPHQPSFQPIPSSLPPNPPQGVEAFSQVCGGGADAGNHGGAAVATQGIAQQARQDVVAVGDVPGGGWGGWVGGRGGWEGECVGARVGWWRAIPSVAYGSNMCCVLRHNLLAFIHTPGWKPKHLPTAAATHVQPQLPVCLLQLYHACNLCPLIPSCSLTCPSAP